MATPLPPSDHSISLDDAVKLTADYRAQGYSGTILPFAFNTAGYERILKQGGCVGIRSYPGLKSDGSLCFVMVGVDDKGNDMVNGELSEQEFLCPPICPDSNVLNGGK